MVDTALREPAVPTRTTRPSGLRVYMQRKSTIAFFMALPLILIIACWWFIRRSIRIHLATLNKSMQHFVGLGNFTFLFKRNTFWMVVEQSCCSPSPP